MEFDDADDAHVIAAEEEAVDEDAEYDGGDVIYDELSETEDDDEVRRRQQQRQQQQLEQETPNNSPSDSQAAPRLVITSHGSNVDTRYRRIRDSIVALCGNQEMVMKTDQRGAKAVLLGEHDLNEPGVQAAYKHGRELALDKARVCGDKMPLSVALNTNRPKPANHIERVLRWCGTSLRANLHCVLREGGAGEEIEIVGQAVNPARVTLNIVAEVLVVPEEVPTASEKSPQQPQSVTSYTRVYFATTESPAAEPPPSKKRKVDSRK
jgi:hypothetical protein